MTHPVQAEERRAAFEVDKHKVQGFRRMHRDHAEDQRSQELRLSRSRSADT
jgi:hypothetical protein